MLHQFSRLELAIGKQGLAFLRSKKVVVVGVGGVGSFALEALARSGIGSLILCDKDVVDVTNINRQIHSTISSIGLSKCQEMKRRILDINPACQVDCIEVFINQENTHLIFDTQPDFVIEAIDTILIKSMLIVEAYQRQVPLISSMGMANKLHPEMIEISNIWDTSYDPLAKIIRQDLKKMGLKHKPKIPVVYSKEPAIVPKKEVLVEIGNPQSTIRKQQLPPSSNAFVPSVAGLITASYVINTLIAQSGVTIDRKQ